MRCSLALVIVMVFASSVRADELAHTREVLHRHASESRTTQNITGVVRIAGGAASGVAGYFMATSPDGGGGLVDLSPLTHALGYTMIGLGGLSIASGVYSLATDNDFERLAADVTDEQDARSARLEIAHHAAAKHRKRMIVRGVGITLAGVAAVGTTVALVGGDRLSDNTRFDLYGSGIALGALGTGFVVGSLVESRWESMHRDLRAPSTAISPGLVPTRGGVLAGVSATF